MIISVLGYDQYGHAGVGMGEGAGQGGFSGGGVHMSMDDIFSQFGDILEEVLLKVSLEEELITEEIKQVVLILELNLNYLLKKFLKELKKK